MTMSSNLSVTQVIMENIEQTRGTAFIVVSNLYVQKVTVLRSNGDFRIVMFGEKRLQLRKSRVFETEQEAQEALKRFKSQPEPNESFRKPSLYEQGI